MVCAMATRAKITLLVHKASRFWYVPCFLPLNIQLEAHPPTPNHAPWSNTRRTQIAPQDDQYMLSTACFAGQHTFNEATPGKSTRHD